jgi:tRNA dimethylallyltransferase
MSASPFTEKKRHTVVILLGPTGVGKTGASILLAQSLKTEIISADSMQVYRHMDIGTAKPSREERALVRHHMIDIVEPSGYFSAGEYIETVAPLIEGLQREGKMPLVVGGTGLYLRAMTRGIFRGPSADWGLREQLLSMEAERGGVLYARLMQLDPVAASRIMPADTRRVVRALEVCLKTETGISELQKDSTTPMPCEFIKIGLTRERQELYRMIERRVDGMVSQGLVDEVEDLLRRTPGKTALQAIGYKEIAAYLRGDSSLDEAVVLIKQRTRNYAKRQLTWFRAEAGIRWLDITGLSSSEEITLQLKKLLPYPEGQGS